MENLAKPKHRLLEGKTEIIAFEARCRKLFRGGTRSRDRRRIAHQRRGETDCGKYSEVARLAACQVEGGGL